MATETLTLDGKSLTTEDVLDVSLHGRRVVLDERNRKIMQQTRDVLENLIVKEETIYGVNTGFGKFAEIRITPDQILELQKNIVLSHAAGVGPELPESIVRAILLLKANGLASGYSGVRPVIVDMLIHFLNKGIHPVIPSQGSVGASGDLAPLAHMTLPMMGLGEAIVRGKRVAGKDALSGQGLSPLILQAKEGLALLNGTQVMTAVGVLSLRRAECLCKSADIVGALSAEALSSNHSPFDDRIQRVRKQRGQIEVASNIRKMIASSEIIQKRPVRRVQEAYCIRCMPQVHGAARDMVAYARSVIECEINGVTDNPLIFSEEKDVLSGGNFHGQPIAMALDGLGVAMTTLGGISERRIARMMDSEASGLPGFLASREGVNSGFMIAQVTAAALASENKTFAHPASADSIPTSANQEDYVSMGMHAALKGMQILDNTECILGIELLVGCQGVELRRPLKSSPALEAVVRSFRSEVGRLEQDRFLAPDIETAGAYIGKGKLLEAVPGKIDIT